MKNIKNLPINNKKRDQGPQESEPSENQVVTVAGESSSSGRSVTGAKLEGMGRVWEATILGEGIPGGGAAQAKAWWLEQETVRTS